MSRRFIHRTRLRDLHGLDRFSEHLDFTRYTETQVVDGTDRSRGSVEPDVSTRDDVYRDPE